MKKLLVATIALAFSMLGTNAADKGKTLAQNYPSILNIAYTPDTLTGGKGWFTDAGSWMGFTIPSKDNWVNGFCGPFTIDSRRWVAKSIAEVGVEKDGRMLAANRFTPDSSSYFPGSTYISSSCNGVKVEQQLFFVDKNHAVLQLSSSSVKWNISSTIWLPNTTLKQNGNTLTITLPTGEIAGISFASDLKLTVKGNSYVATGSKPSNKTYAVISIYNNDAQRATASSKVSAILKNPSTSIAQSRARWNGYLAKTLRNGMPESYNGIAVKSLVTLMANWRSAKGDLLHDGVVPSHAVGYFVGMWAWDSWKHAVALSRIDPELAKNQIRAMFDYQMEDGMVIDCIYSDKKENNYRDSKPPLAAWAVMEVYKQAKDVAFVKEIFPKLVKYNRWWFTHRDHDHNGICEFGSIDGTDEAAKWESGMDNAVRFDSSKMEKNSEAAWSFDQESVDLNAFLYLENKLLKDMAKLIGASYSDAFDGKKMDNYFFDSSKGYYYDRKLGNGFVSVEGSEGYIPMWVKMASKEHAAAVMKMYEKPSKFSTYIPFPTLCADNPQFTPNGYWRGPIWLDQVYFAISGIRNYGYVKEADTYTDQVFTRLNGLMQDAPIHENYDTQTGKRLKAPHFSWSAAHLLMLYWEYKK
jgi:putative isomerase